MINEQAPIILKFNSDHGGQLFGRLITREEFKQRLENPIEGGNLLDRIDKQLDSSELRKRHPALSAENHEQEISRVHAAVRKIRPYLASVQYPIDSGKSPQPTKVKVSFPFNPSFETNILKTEFNAHGGETAGFGGAAQVTTGGAGAYDVIGASVQSLSTRYNQYTSRNIDSVVIQAAYQFFLGGQRYDGNGEEIPISVPPVGSTVPSTQPPIGLITYETLAFGIVNQASYTPFFGAEKADLVTPQATLGIQNISLLGADNTCKGKDGSKDPGKNSSFCYYLDLSLTVGQTSSDVATLENANVAFSASFGKRFADSDWKLLLQTTVTERSYEHVVGGRNDVLYQVGPTLSAQYKLPGADFEDTLLTFALPATYNDNSSTIAKDSWRGWVILPALTLAFQMPKKKLN